MSEQDKKQEVVQTICKDCIFAHYNGARQDACELGRIKAYMEQGANIERVEENRRKYFVIHDRYCNANRHHEMAKGNVEKFKRETLEFIKTRIECLVFWGADIEKTLQSIANQKHKPKQVTIILPSELQTNLVPLMKMLDGYHFEKWRLEYFTDDYTVEKMIDKCAFKSKCNYVHILNAGTVVSDNRYADLEKLVNKQLQQVIFTDDDEYEYPNNYMFHLPIYKAFGGMKKHKNLPQAILEKKDKDESNSDNSESQLCGVDCQSD